MEIPITPALLYLPGELARYLDPEAPATHPSRKSQENLYRLRELVIAGFYRAAARRARYTLIYCESAAYLDPLADIFCSMIPFRERLATTIFQGVVFGLPEFAGILLACCAKRFNPSAFRFIYRPYYSLMYHSSLPGLKYFPGYVECLVSNLTALVRSEWRCHALPSTYEEMEQAGLLGLGPISYGYDALAVGNYRLVRYLKDRYPEKKFSEFAINTLGREGHPRCKKMLAWMLKEGWITQSDVDDVLRVQPDF